MTRTIKRASLGAAAVAALCLVALAPCARATYITAAPQSVTPEDEPSEAPSAFALSGLSDPASSGWMVDLPAPKAGAGQSYDTAALPESSPNVVVPEPATIALLGLGVICLTLLRRKPAQHAGRPS